MISLRGNFCNFKDDAYMKLVLNSVEFNAGCKTGDFETVQDREMEPKEEAENTDDGKREQEEHKEVGIEINVEKGEKDEFNDQEEGEQEKLSEIKQGIKTKKVCTIKFNSNWSCLFYKFAFHIFKFCLVFQMPLEE